MISERRLTMILTLLLCLLFPASALANAAEPPSFTVIVFKPPPGLSLALLLSDGMRTEPVTLSKEEKGWEAYYRFFYHTYPGGQRSLDGAVLIVEYDEGRFECDLPAETFSEYNNLLTLDIRAQTVVSGQPPWRTPTLIALRVLLTLSGEGLIFFLFGYRMPRSWFAFVVINLVTQGTLNSFLTGPQIGAYWLLGFAFGEAIVLAVEMIAFAYFVREFSKRRAILYALTANVVSLIVGGLLISKLPI